MDEFITVIFVVAMVLGLAYCGVKQGVPDEMQAVIDPGQRVVKRVTLAKIQEGQVTVKELSMPLNVEFSKWEEAKESYLSPSILRRVGQFYVVGTTKVLLKLCIHDEEGPRCVSLKDSSRHNPKLLAAVKSLPNPVSAEPATASAATAQASAAPASPVAANTSKFSSF